MDRNKLQNYIINCNNLHLTASKPTGKTIGLISETTFEQNIIKCILKNYPYLCIRLVRSKNHNAKSTFKENFKPTQQKCRRVPLHPLERVEKELENLIEYKQTMRLEKCSDKYFMSPVVITVKKYKSFKIALDSKQLKELIHKNKYQMQSIDQPIDAVATHISERSTKNQWYNIYIFSDIFT